jgi:competence protein ComEC
MVGVAAGLVSVAALRVRTGLLLLGAGLVIAEAFATRAGSPRGVLRVTFLDVAQGDAALVDLPDGRAMLVDAGGLVGSPVDVGERVLAPVLRARRRARLEAFVLSHPHPDHALGAIRGLARVDVARAWDTGQGEAEHAGAFYTGALATARARGARLERPGELCGHHAFGGAEVDVIAPCPGPDASRGPNDNSFVIRISYGARSFLFVGDAEHAEEEGLLRAGANVRADVLKVGHHGSRTSSSPGFVAAVAPRLAVISSGVRNRFGHPHRPTLLTFARAGVRVLRTDAVGAVTVTTDGASLEVSTAEDPP